MDTRKEHTPVSSPTSYHPVISNGRSDWRCLQSQNESAGTGHQRIATSRAVLERVLSLSICCHQLLRIFLLEWGSMVGRMRLRWKQRPFRVAGFPVYRLAQDGHPEPCTDSLACMKDTGNFFSSFPRATLIDVQTYQEGWKAGARWTSSNPDSYKLDLLDKEA